MRAGVFDLLACLELFGFPAGISRIGPFDEATTFRGETSQASFYGTAAERLNLGVAAGARNWSVSNGRTGKRSPAVPKKRALGREIWNASQSSAAGVVTPRK